MLIFFIKFSSYYIIYFLKDASKRYFLLVTKFQKLFVGTYILFIRVLCLIPIVLHLLVWILYSICSSIVPRVLIFWIHGILLVNSFSLRTDWLIASIGHRPFRFTNLGSFTIRFMDSHVFYDLKRYAIILRVDDWWI